jgi:amino acid permease
LNLNGRSLSRAEPLPRTTTYSTTLKPRHLRSIVIRESIRTGFFVGSESALNRGASHLSPLKPRARLILGQGPETLLVDFAIMGVMILNVGKSSLLDIG